MFENDLQYDLKNALNRLNISDLETLREKLPTTGIPQNLTDKQILLFYNACNFSIENTIKVIKFYYQTRKSTPEHFRNRDPLDEGIKQCLKNQSYFALPAIEEGGPIYVYHKLLNSTASNYFFDNAVKTYNMTIDAALYKYGPTSGIIFVHDMENVGFMHLFRANLSTMRSFLAYLQYGLPAKVCRIHIFNVNSIFSKILALVKPFLKKELLEIIYTHQSNMNYDEFYSKWIPQSHLPSDYGGNLKSIDDLHAEFCNEILQLREYFLAEEVQRRID